MTDLAHFLAATMPYWSKPVMAVLALFVWWMVELAVAAYES